MLKTILSLLALSCSSLSAFEICNVNVWGKVEAGPAYIHLDIIRNHKTAFKMDMPAVRADATVIIGQGWNFRPVVMWGKHEGEFLSTGIGFGRCIPFNDSVIFTPLIGVNYSQVLTHFRYFIPMLGKIEIKQKFEAWAPWLGLEGTYIISSCWRLTAQGQYAWSRSRTCTEGLGDCKSDSKGPVFGLLVEHDFSKKWSMNLGAGWNLSLSKDKCGIRGRGIKLGIARWF
jgi:hypothetical protein